MRIIKHNYTYEYYHNDIYYSLEDPDFYEFMRMWVKAGIKNKREYK
mgnify:CR=1 FL=1